MNLTDLTVIEALEKLRKREISSKELVQSCLQKIKKYDKLLNSFITVCEKESLMEAEKADKDYKRNNKQKRPLLGIPLGIKDIFVTKGIRTTAGSKVLDNYIPQYDATVVARLKEAGAIIIGKNNLDAWAHGASGENSDYGPTRNPWNTTCVPGGSSSGSGAAVAAGQCLAATGTDTGGSIRLPSSFCGLVGMKPTYGRVSRYGVIAMASSLDSPGLITKTVSDQALLLGAIAGRDNFDATMPDVDVPDYLNQLNKKLKNIKIGIPKQYFVKEISATVKQLVDDAIKQLEKLGFRFQEVSLPHTEYAIPCYYIIVPSEISSNLARYDGVRYGFPRDRFADEAKRRIMLGTHSLSSGYYDAYYLKAQKIRTLIKADFEKAFKQVDTLIAPVYPGSPFKIGEKNNDPLEMYLCDILTAPANLAGLPAISVPCGFTNDNLPVGFQLIGSQFSETRLLQLAYQYEQVNSWGKQKPKLD